MYDPSIFIEVYILGFNLFEIYFFVKIVFFDSYIFHNGVFDLTTHKLQ